MFNKLTPNAIKKIIISEINYYIDLYQKVDSIHFDIDADALASMLIFKNANSLDIRNLKKEVKSVSKKPIIDSFIQSSIIKPNMEQETIMEEEV